MHQRKLFVSLKTSASHSKYLSTFSGALISFRKSLLEPKTNRPDMVAEKLFFAAARQSEQTAFKTILLPLNVNPSFEQQLNAFKTTSYNPENFFLATHLDAHTQQQLLTMHIWLVNRFLLYPQIFNVVKETPTFFSKHLRRKDFKKKVQIGLFNNLWETYKRKLRYLDTPEMSISKFLTEMQTNTFGACTAYDAALDTFSSKKVNPIGYQEFRDSLEGAIWRNLFNKCDLNEKDERKVELFADYLEQQLHLFHSKGFGELKESPERIVERVKGIDWVNADFLEDGELTSNVKNELEFEGNFANWDESDWVEDLARSGKPYFWNRKTREVVWDSPF
eukprot:snap_masked-scaffold_2-processed-gene-2.11-mRNA-1 protein AED:1.00 eAED:1.00 QI:0/-1/0/0/-1/1/1/0/334